MLLLLLKQPVDLVLGKLLDLLLSFLLLVLNLLLVPPDHFLEVSLGLAIDLAHVLLELLVAVLLELVGLAVHCVYYIVQPGETLGLLLVVDYSKGAYGLGRSRGDQE